MNRETVNQSDKPKKTMKKGITAILLAFTLVMGSFVILATPNGSNPTVAVAEAKAKKDKKKPVIKFSGKSKITVEKNEVVKIPKTTAKDNKDGNITKKITVTVKKGKTSYKSIATKIKKNKKVKFSSVEKYTITYTVKDKAGNKATKKRYVTVVDSSKKTETSDETTQTTTQQTPGVTTQATTEEVTTEQQTTETVTYNTKKVVVDGRTYNVTMDEFWHPAYSEDSPKINIENDFSDLYLGLDVTNDSQYLKFLGNITATDVDGNDITDKIIIFEERLKIATVGYRYPMRILVIDSKGRGTSVELGLNIRYHSNGVDYEMAEEQGLVVLSEDPVVYGKLRNQE